MKAFLYHDKALSDLHQIWTHIAEDAGASVAIRFAQRIDDTIRRVISEHPGAGRQRPEFGRDVRSFPVVPYIVFYREEERETVVLRILHGRRDIKRPLMSLLIAAS